MSPASVRNVLKTKGFTPELAWAAAIVVGCSAQAQGWERAVAGPTPAPLVGKAQNEGQWVLLPEYTESQSHLLEKSGRELLIAQGLRIADSPDGTLNTAREIFPVAQVVPVKLPARLGGGYLFYGKKGAETPIWRAADFTGDLSPLATVTERVLDVVPGFDRLYVQLEHSRDLIALDPNTGEPVDLGPLPQSPSFNALAFADEWFAAVNTDVRGLMVSYDAGATWHPTGRSTSHTTLRVEEETIVAERQNLMLRLTPDGRFAEIGDTNPDALFRLPSTEALLSMPVTPRPPAATALPLGRRPLRDAALYGHPLDSESAVIATFGGLGQIRLRDGKVLRLKTAAYPGVEPCPAVTLGDGIGFVCSEREQGTQIYQLARDFSLRLIANFRSARFVSASGNGRLVVRGPCAAGADAGATSEFQPYCVLSFEGATPALQGATASGSTKPSGPSRQKSPGDAKPVKTREIRVRGDVGAERVIALNDGRVAVLIPPRLGTAGSLNIIGKEVKSIPLKVDPKDNALGVLSRGLWLHGGQQVSPTQIATWAVHSNSYVGVRVSLSGKVESAPFNDALDIEKAVISGPFALDLGTGQETASFGFDWTEVDLPESLNTLSPNDKRKETSTKPLVGCSAVGCAYGAWLRIGRSTSARLDDSERRSSARLVVAMPKNLADHQNAFSSWRFRCYATGERNRPAQTLARELNRAAKERPRRGAVSGFVTPALMLSSTSADIAEINYRSFFGVPGPTLGRGQLGFDLGEERSPRFRAYSWGDGKSEWAGAAWLVRAANRFELDSLWSTAVTTAPWSDVGEAASVFGADRVSRYSSSWHFSLDPDETVGLLRIASAGSHELHVIAKDKPIDSLKGTKLRNIDGVVKARGELYFGSKSGTLFRVFRLRGDRPKLFGSYPINSDLKAELVRSSDGESLGILIRAARGTWHVYPLDASGQARAPLFYSRALLNAKAPTCSEGASGWLVASELPPSRLTVSNSLQLLDFDGPVRALGVTGKLILTEDSLCVTELAAQLARGGEAAARLKKRPPSSTASVSMVLSDYGRDARYGFRCE